MGVDVIKTVDQASDDDMADLFIECITWLIDGGRENAKLLQAVSGPDMNWEEAMSWLEDIAEGKEIA